jgi:thiol-disulfide isomerase/thioredoxin
MSRRSWIAAAVVAVAALSAGVAFYVLRGPFGGGSSDHGHAEDGPVVIHLLEDRTPVPDFTLTDLSGRTLISSEWRGKVVLINFWATWCLPCRVEIPDLVELQEKYRDELIVVGVSEDEDGLDKVQAFAKEHKVNYPIVMVTPELRKIFPNIEALPTTFVLDREGRLAQRTVGLLNARATEAVARSLAGLEVNAKIEYVGMQGVDLSQVPEDRRAEVKQALNDEACTCGCGLSVARCRTDDPTCSVSLPQAKAIIDRVVANR